MASELLGVKLDPNSKEELYNKVISLAKTNSSKASFVARPNAEIITYAQNHPDFKEILNSAAISIPDGTGVYLAAKLLGIKVAGRFGGPESMFELLGAAEKENLSVYLLGARAEVVKLAARNIKKALPQINISGFHEGYFQNNDEVISEINQLKPHLIFVGMGSPLQEQWVAENISKFETGVFVMEGGSFDYLSGKVRRAPIFMRKLGLEWLFRLVREPQRISRQIKLIKFVFLTFRARLSK